jgi:hypothetical protein
MDGFVSGSFASSAAFSNKGLHIELLVPKGKRALSFYDASSGFKHECEVVLDHGQSYRCVSMEEAPNGKTIIKAMLI